jgi:hypothetical protein
VIDREAATLDAVEQNHDTPCVRNARSVLLCAVSRELRGDAERSAELEALADALQLEGHGVATKTPRARLAIARGQLDRSRSSSPTTLSKRRSRRGGRTSSRSRCVPLAWPEATTPSCPRRTSAFGRWPLTGTRIKRRAAEPRKQALG